MISNHEKNKIKSQNNNQRVPKLDVSHLVSIQLPDNNLSPIHPITIHKKVIPTLITNHYTQTSHSTKLNKTN